MSSLSTHVLDTMHGTPAAGVSIALFEGEALLFEGMTDADGRCPDIRALTLTPGAYRIRFEVAGYYRARGVDLPEPPFLDRVSIDFGIADATSHYHVPLLVSPYGYSTYRGS